MLTGTFRKIGTTWVLSGKPFLKYLPKTTKINRSRFLRGIYSNGTLTDINTQRRYWYQNDPLCVTYMLKLFIFANFPSAFPPMTSQVKKTNYEHKNSSKTFIIRFWPHKPGLFRLSATSFIDWNQKINFEKKFFWCLIFRKKIFWVKFFEIYFFVPIDRGSNTESK